MEGMTDMGKSELLYGEFNVHEAQTNRPDWSYNYTKGVVLPSLRTECHLTGNMCCELNLNVGTIQQPTAKITLNDTVERIMHIMSINQGKIETPHLSLSFACTKMRFYTVFDTFYNAVSQTG